MNLVLVRGSRRTPLCVWFLGEDWVGTVTLDTLVLVPWVKRGTCQTRTEESHPNPDGPKVCPVTLQGYRGAVPFPKLLPFTIRSLSLQSIISTNPPT